MLLGLTSSNISTSSSKGIVVFWAMLPCWGLRSEQASWGAPLGKHSTGQVATSTIDRASKAAKVFAIPPNSYYMQLAEQVSRCGPSHFIAHLNPKRQDLFVCTNSDAKRTWQGLEPGTRACTCTACTALRNALAAQSSSHARAYKLITWCIT